MQETEKTRKGSGAHLKREKRRVSEEKEKG
jgi:hypothetical protein